MYEKAKNTVSKTAFYEGIAKEYGKEELTACSIMKEGFFYNDWAKEPGVAISFCNDGFRPVIFKLEATDEESVNDF